MARIRYIKPEFFSDDQLCSLPPHDRLAFAGLWCHADREGRLEDRPTRLRALIFPYEPKVNFNAILTRLEEIGSVQRYEVDGRKLLYIPGFAKHQRPHSREIPSDLPAPDGQCQSTTQAVSEHHLGDAEPSLGDAEPCLARARNGEWGREQGQGQGQGTSAKSVPTVALATPSAPLGRRSHHRSHAVCGRPCLPAACFDEFSVKAPPGFSLDAWALRVMDTWADKPIGDDDFAFWRARWLEEWGTTRTAAKPVEDAKPDYSAVHAQILREEAERDAAKQRANDAMRKVTDMAARKAMR